MDLLPMEKRVIGTDSRQLIAKLRMPLGEMLLGGAFIGASVAGAVAQAPLPKSISCAVVGILLLALGGYWKGAVEQAYSQLVILREKVLTVQIDRAAAHIPWADVKSVTMCEERVEGEPRPKRWYDLELGDGRRETVRGYVLRESDEEVLHRHLEWQVARSEGRITSNLLPATAVWVLGGKPEGEGA